MSQLTYYDISFRLDGSDPERLLRFLEAEGGNYFVVRELADSNSHYHGYVRTKRKVHAFRMQFRRSVCESAGNGAYSVTAVRDVDKYYRYMCKGSSRETLPDVVASSGLQYSASWVQETHDRYWATNDQLMAQRSKLKTWEAVMAACKDASIAWHDKEKIALAYIRELTIRNQAINIFSVRSNVQLIQVKLCPDDTAIEELAKQV